LTLMQMGFVEKNEVKSSLMSRVKMNDLTSDCECTVNHRVFKSGETFRLKKEDHAGFAFMVEIFFRRVAHYRGDQMRVVTYGDFYCRAVGRSGW